MLLYEIHDIILAFGELNVFAMLLTPQLESCDQISILHGQGSDFFFSDLVGRKQARFLIDQCWAARGKHRQYW